MQGLIDYRKLIKRIWLILWLILLMLVIAKLLFNKWYPIVVDNEKFITICNYIDKHNIIKYIIMLFFYILSNNLWYLTATKQKRIKGMKNFITLNVLVIGTFVVKHFNNNVGAIVECITLIIVPIVLNLKRNSCGSLARNILMPIIIYILINAWQFTIFFIRDIDYEVLTTLPLLISYILMIDYYIFIIIQWTGVAFMGLFSGGWLFGKTDVELKALKEQELKKKNPDKKIIEAIDKRLKALEK